MQTGQLLASGTNDRSGTAKECAKFLRGHLEDVVGALSVYQEEFREALPKTANQAFSDLIEDIWPHVKARGETSDSIYRHVWTALIQLAAFESEVTFLLSGNQESIRARSERAFTHLRRSIVVDPDVRAKWQAAFATGEVACEKLGSVHLLLHGIWAFKVDAIGARTDLLLEESADNLVSPDRYSDGLVLTEWKSVHEDQKSIAAYEAARSQARKYKEGPLAATELRGYRYAIVVSDHQVPVPPDVLQGEVVYRHVNIAVNPRVPSDVRAP
jgi:hypothetical protein